MMMGLLLAAALAPTDAALGAATVLNPRVPIRVRRILNVESGLNDGLATPVVLFAIAEIAGQEGLGPVRTIGDAAADLAIGGAAGAAVGAAGAALLTWSRRHRTSTAPSRALAVMFLPLLAFGVAAGLSGNGYVAAFVCGTVFAGGAVWLGEEESALRLTEALSDPLAYAVWLVFGFAASSLVWDGIGPREVGFAVLSLTVLRMAPVALVMIGTGMRLRTLAFLGWFGPRGLVTVVFAVLALESLAPDEELAVVLTTITLTVLLSVIAHGLTAPPLARAYGQWIAAQPPGPETEGGSLEPRTRGVRLMTPQPWERPMTGPSAQRVGPTRPVSRGTQVARQRLALLVKVAATTGDFSPRLAGAVGAATAEEVQILSDLVDRGLSIPALVSFLQGAHLMIGDVALYERWIFPSSRPRLSSHHRSVDKARYPDYGYEGPLVREALHGRTTTGTWVQLERSRAMFRPGRLPTWTDLVHLRDYVIYRVTGRNVGPWGLSARVDTRPMVLRPASATTGLGCGLRPRGLRPAPCGNPATRTRSVSGRTR